MTSKEIILFENDEFKLIQYNEGFKDDIVLFETKEGAVNSLGIKRMPIHLSINTSREMRDIAIQIREQSVGVFWENSKNTNTPCVDAYKLQSLIECEQMLNKIKKAFRLFRTLFGFTLDDDNSD